MKSEEAKTEHAQMAEELGQRTGRGDGLRVVGGLVAGFALLRRSLYARLHEDVERILGRDSMFMPVSEVKTEIAVGTEIELSQIAESAAAARDGGYAGPSPEWYPGWLARLRFSQAADRPPQPGERRIDDRVADYLAQTPEGRRLAFSTAVARLLPEARRRRWSYFSCFPWRCKSPRPRPSPTARKPPRPEAAKPPSCRRSLIAGRATAKCSTAASNAPPAETRSGSPNG